MNNLSPILIVEDDPDWVDIIKKYLGEEFTCLVSINCEDALNLLDTISPLALVLDLNLDKSIVEDSWGGWKLAQSAKEHHISSIIVSGYPKDEIYYRAYREFKALRFFEKSRLAYQKTDFIKCVHEAVEQTKRKNIFISYSHKDRKWLDKFVKNLKVLERNNLLAVWDDTKLKSGDKWKDEINNALLSAKVALLLVSPDFLASDFIYNNELPPLLKSAEKKGLTIIWVAVRSSLYDETPISEYQAANDPAKPLASLSAAELDSEIVRICKIVRDAVLSSP